MKYLKDVLFFQKEVQNSKIYTHNQEAQSFNQTVAFKLKPLTITFFFLKNIFTIQIQLYLLKIYFF